MEFIKQLFKEEESGKYRRVTLWKSPREIRQKRWDEDQSSDYFIASESVKGQPFSIDETYLFLSDNKGEVISWEEIFGKRPARSAESIIGEFAREMEEREFEV